MISNILEVRVANESFGIDADKIEHILRTPPITSIPVVDKAIKGVSVILGKIISIVDVGILLGLEEVKNSETSRILNISDDTAIMVDEVLDIISIDEKNFEEIEDENLVGFYKFDNKIIQILNIETIVNKIEYVDFSPKRISKLSNNTMVKKEAQSDIIRTLFCGLGDEKYGIDIDIIKEIVFIPEITPTTNPNEIGLITLREEVVPLIDFNALFGFKSKITDKSRAIIIWHKNRNIAILVDEVLEVNDIKESMIEKIQSQQIEGIYKGDEITSIVSIEYLKDLINKFNITEENETITKRDNEMIEVVVFKIEEEEFAFDIKDVQEIIKYEKPTFFPQAPNFVEGLMNLRGSVIPVVSLPKKLGFNEIITDKTKIIVCDIFDEKIGFIVNDVSDIMFIEDIYLSKLENDDSIFDEVINLDEERVIFKIDTDKLFTDEEIKGIKLTKVNDGEK